MDRKESVFLAKKLFTVCRINKRVSRNESLEWGVLRTGAINLIPNPTKRATEYFCYAARAQLFWDGNKRTSTITSSKILIEAGEGVLTVGKADALNFNEALLHLYDTEDKGPLKECLCGCIKTMVVKVGNEKPGVEKSAGKPGN